MGVVILFRQQQISQIFQRYYINNQYVLPISTNNKSRFLTQERADIAYLNFFVEIFCIIRNSSYFW